MQKIIKLARNYFDSNYFIAITYLFTILCWYLKDQRIAMIYYLLMTLLIILLNARRASIITLIFAAIINYRETTFQSNMNIVLFMVAFGAPIILIDFFRRKVKLKNEIFIAMIILLLANILSLINTTENTFHLGLVGVAQNIAFCALFLYFYNTNDKDINIYISKNALALGIAIALEFILYIITYQDDILGKDIELGWGISNSIAMVLLLVIPLTIYLYSQYQKHNFILFFVMIDILLVILMLSKGAYLSLGLVFFPIFAFVFFFIKNRKKFIIDLIFSGLIFIVMLIFIFRFDILAIGIREYMERMDGRGWFNDPARVKIYKYGFEVFKKYPILGAGSYSNGYNLVTGGFSEVIKHYHNYIIQTLATLGIVGLLSFGYYIFVIIKSCIKKNIYNILVLFAIIAMLIHGLVDNTWHNPIIMVIVTIYIVGVSKNKESSYD
ncbi:MAG TPA: O-antigen ligase family protein [Acholeplasmataceae bacterium]|nr:O-antigen ligase family protein [Acholeplasmataceae bacterium]